MIAHIIWQKNIRKTILPVCLRSILSLINNILLGTTLCRQESITQNRRKLGYYSTGYSRSVVRGSAPMLLSPVSLSSVPRSAPHRTLPVVRALPKDIELPNKLFSITRACLSYCVSVVGAARSRRRAAYLLSGQGRHSVAVPRRRPVGQRISRWWQTLLRLLQVTWTKINLIKSHSVEICMKEAELCSQSKATASHSHLLKKSWLKINFQLNIIYLCFRGCVPSSFWPDGKQGMEVLALPASQKMMPVRPCPICQG